MIYFNQISKSFTLIASTASNMSLYLLKAPTNQGWRWRETESARRETTRPLAKVTTSSFSYHQPCCCANFCNSTELMNFIPYCAPVFRHDAVMWPFVIETVLISWRREIWVWLNASHTEVLIRANFEESSKRLNCVKKSEFLKVVEVTSWYPSSKKDVTSPTLRMQLGWGGISQHIFALCHKSTFCPVDVSNNVNQCATFSHSLCD